MLNRLYPGHTAAAEPERPSARFLPLVAPFFIAALLLSGCESDDLELDEALDEEEVELEEE